MRFDLLPCQPPWKPRRGCHSVAVGKGTFFVPAAHGSHPYQLNDPEGVEWFNPARAEGFYMRPYRRFHLGCSPLTPSRYPLLFSPFALAARTWSYSS